MLTGQPFFMCNSKDYSQVKDFRLHSNFFGNNLTFQQRQRFKTKKKLSENEKIFFFLQQTKIIPKQKLPTKLQLHTNEKHNIIPCMYIMQVLVGSFSRFPRLCPFRIKFAWSQFYLDFHFVQTQTFALSLHRNNRI